MIFGRKPVTEAYVGDNHKEFKVIEKEISGLLKIIHRDYKPLIDRIGSADYEVFNRKGPDTLNNSVHNRKIEDQFKKFFGLKEFRLVWIQTGKPNAMTPCRSYTFMDKGPDKEGRYRNDKLTIAMMFDVNLITYMDLNEREIMAIILHEIGHNFYNSIFQTLSRLPINIYASLTDPNYLMQDGARPLINIAQSLTVFGLFDVLNFPKMMVDSREKIDTFLQKHAAPIMNLYRMYNEILHNTIGFMNIRIRINPSDVLNLLPMFLLRFASTDVIFGYHTERFADNFAADHGYGKDLATAIEKFDHQKKNLSVVATDNIPGLNWIADAMRVQIQFLLAMIDEHPQSMIRVRSGLDRLKQHAKDPSIDARTRKDLEKEIKEYEQFYSDYKNLSKNGNAKRVFTWLNKVVMDKLFAGKGDLRELTWMLDSKSRIPK